jgi:hypothetical protein
MLALVEQDFKSVVMKEIQQVVVAPPHRPTIKRVDI